MNTKMIVKFHTYIPYKKALDIQKDLLNQWNNNGIVLLPPNIDIQAIIIEDEKCEINVINLTKSSVKNKKNILKKIIKTILHKK